MRGKVFGSIILIVMVLNGLQKASAQQKTMGAIASQLHISWEIIINNYQNKTQSRSVMVFTAGSGQALPAKGWKLYFNFARKILPESLTGNLQLTHINGDLFYLQPSPAFKGLPAGQSLEVAFTSTDWVINATDAPGGFYWVWDNQPANAYAVKSPVIKPSTNPEQYLRTPLDKVALTNAETIYHQNEAIGNIAPDSLIKVFPTPVAYREIPGYFLLNGAVKINADAGFELEKTYLKQTLATILLPVKNTATAYTIALKRKPMPAEAYELAVDHKVIVISAGSNAGIFYGIQSLKTLITPGAWQHPQAVIRVKNVSVTDAPRFPYRAVMLDVARNFQPKNEILKLLDVMSLYKLNVLHFHLTDDEGWRLAIPGLPELTDVGGRRGYTLNGQTYLQPALNSGPEVANQQGSGHYSRADFIEILKYASQRHIKVIPEIESPGHARAAIKAMDARYHHYLQLGQKAKAEEFLLHDFGDTSKYQSVQYWNDNVMDVSMPSVYRFITKITNELVQLYRDAGAPLQTIHFGGDEVPAGAWQRSPSFTQLSKTNQAIRTVDDLWPYYYTRVNDILKTHQLYLTAWEETGLVKATENGKKVNVLNNALLNQNVHLEVWNNVLGWGAEDLAYKQANAGYKVILSCVSNLYFDMAAEKAFDEPGYYWGGYVDIDKLFNFIPYNYFKNTTEDRMGNPLNTAYLNTKEKLTEEGQANIIGLQGALWGESLKSPQQLEYMLLPKLLGLAERAWAANPNWATEPDSAKSARLYQTAWSNFINIVGKRELPRLNYYGGGFSYRIPKPGAIKQGNQVMMNSRFPGFGIRYTIDGSIPTAKSTLYTAPVPYHPKIKMALFNNAMRSSAIGL